MRGDMDVLRIKVISAVIVVQATPMPRVNDVVPFLNSAWTVEDVKDIGLSKYQLKLRHGRSKIIRHG